MAGFGPPPKQRTLRPKPDGMRALRILPAAGRDGPPPPWPFGAQSEMEAAVWAELWSTPMAVAWEADHCTRVVARYCRRLIAVEGIAAHASHLAEVRQLEDRLGLTPMALLRLRWAIDDPEPATVTPIARMLSERDPRRRVRPIDPNAS